MPEPAQDAAIAEHHGAAAGASPRWRVALLRHGPVLACGLLAIVLALVLPRPWRLAAHVAVALPWAVLTLAALLLCATLVLVRAVQASNAAGRRGWLADLLVASVAMLVLVALVPGRALVETDESAFANSADAIRFTAAIRVPNSGIYDGARILHPTTVDLEKRGVLYPLLLAPLRALLDDPAQAGIRLNLAVGWLLLVLLARLYRQLGGTTVGAATAVLLFATLPVVAVTLRSGTYDPLNCLLLLALASQALATWRRPDPLALALLAALAAVVVQVRYESLVVAALALGLLQLRVAAVHPVPAHAGHALWSLALVPGAWRLAVPIDLELPAGVDHAWGADHLLRNVGALADWLQAATVHASLFVLAMLGAVLLAGTRRTALIAAWRAGGWLPPLLLAALLLLLGWSYWGQLLNPVTARYFLPLCAALALLAAVLAERVPGAGLRVAVLLLGAAGLVASARDGHAEWERAVSLPAYRDQVLRHVGRSYPACNVLLVTDYPTLFLARGHGAIFPDDWIGLQHDIDRVLAMLAVDVVVATTLQVPGMAQDLASPPLRQALAVGPVVSLPGPLSVARFVELHTGAGPAPCNRRLRPQGIDRTDLAGAQRLWEVVSDAARGRQR